MRRRSASAAGAPGGPTAQFTRRLRGDRPLLLHWLLYNVAAIAGLIALAVTYASKIHGPSVAVIAIIIIITFSASLFGGRLCWALDTDRRTFTRSKTIKNAEWITFWAWTTPMIGMMGTVFGFWRILTAGGTDTDLHDRILSGGGVALSGTFIGIISTIFLSLIHRLIDHEVS